MQCLLQGCHSLLLLQQLLLPLLSLLAVNCSAVAAAAVLLLWLLPATHTRSFCETYGFVLFHLGLPVVPQVLVCFGGQEQGTPLYEAYLQHQFAHSGCHGLKDMSENTPKAVWCIKMHPTVSPHCDRTQVSVKVMIAS